MHTNYIKHILYLGQQDFRMWGVIALFIISEMSAIS